MDFLRTPPLRYELLRSTAAFAVVTVVGFLFGQLYPQLRDAWLGRYTVGGAVLSPLDLLSSGLVSCGLAILVGLIPFVQLPAMSLGANGILLGAVFSQYIGQGGGIAAYLAATLPHAIFQLPALLVSFALGLRLCALVTASVRQRKADPRLRPTLNAVSEVYFLLLFPLLSAAALAEVFVSPRLYALF